MKNPSIRRFLRHGTLPQLAALAAIVRLGGFTRAADSLHLAQSTVSGHVRKLAEATGVALFTTARGVPVPTAAARVLERAAHEVFGALERAEATLAALRVGDAAGSDLGTAQVATAASVSIVVARDDARLATQVAALLPRLADDWPAFDLSLQVLAPPVLAARLAGGGDDLYLFAQWPVQARSGPLRADLRIEALGPQGPFALVSTTGGAAEAAGALVALLRAPAEVAPGVPARPPRGRPALRVVA